ncbi:MAG: carbamoyltransferase HypF [Bacteroidota bacterium]
MHTEQHHIEGQVQGVGFRPHVWRLAHQHGLTGWVRNGTDGVRIAVQGDVRALDAFAEAVVAQAPPVARVTRHRRWTTEPVERFDGFAIVPSDDSGARTLVLTPDLNACDACLAETRDPADRRHGYAFASCTHCGPRYSIVEALPYDRPTTTMGAFPLCSRCAAEYGDPADRRYHAQTTSCPTCRIPLVLRATDGTVLAAEGNALDIAARRLAVGECIAVKGIGGYLLCVDARNAEAVARLRRRKARPTKPFAVLAAHLDAVKEFAIVDDDEAELLRSRARPIVLLRKRDRDNAGDGHVDVAPYGSPIKSGMTGRGGESGTRVRAVAENVAPGLDRVGVMLPCAPLLALLLDRVGRPLVATSGNVSETPIAYTDERALRDLAPLADAFLTHPRAIVAPQDDSVVALTPTRRQRIVVRRSRGYAPTLLGPCMALPDGLLAMGAQQKSTFAFTHGGHAYVSQYLGDLHSFDAEQAYAHTQAHLLGVLQAQPRRLVVDQHPDYFATCHGRAQAEAWDVPVMAVQHHESHAAAVLAENDLTDCPEPVLCVVWDGTGLGTDAQIWGGEFFLYRSPSCVPEASGDGAAPVRFERVAHWGYVPHLLGNKMARDPRIAALAFCHAHLDDPEAEARLADLFDRTSWRFYRKLIAQPTLRTSSVGRLFDAVACLLSLTDTVSFEGEAAMLLEQAARRGYEADVEASAYSLGATLTEALDPHVLIGHVLTDLDAGRDRNAIALAFHRTLVAAIRRVAEATDVRRLAFSGGVFQNELLVDLVHDECGGEFALHFHDQLSPNDESIAYGQLVHAALHQQQAAPVLAATDFDSITTTS